MRRLTTIALALLALVAGCGGGQPVEGQGTMRYYHDAEHGVGCWVAYSGTSCLPDSEYRVTGE